MQLEEPTRRHVGASDFRTHIAHEVASVTIK